MRKVWQTKNGRWNERGKYGTSQTDEPPRRLKLDLGAVSPIIAVILMVAITVVLAATVFVLVSDIHPAATAPIISWSADKVGKNITVYQAPLGLTWDQFTVTGCGFVPTGTVDAGDVISACNGTVSITHKPSNSLSYKDT